MAKVIKLKTSNDGAPNKLAEIRENEKLPKWMFAFSNIHKFSYEQLRHISASHLRLVTDTSYADLKEHLRQS